MIDSDLFYVAQFEIFHSFLLAYKELRVFRSGAMSLGEKNAVFNRQMSAEEGFLDFTGKLHVKYWCNELVK